MSTSSRPTRVAEAARFDCPRCKAPAGESCRSLLAGIVTKRPHAERMAAARKAGY